VEPVRQDGTPESSDGEAGTPKDIRKTSERRCWSRNPSTRDNVGADTQTIGGRTMKNQRILVALTVINLGLLTFQMVRPRLAFAQEAAPVLRGRSPEIVDDRERLRAAIKVLRGDPTTASVKAVGGQGGWHG
jgi:hypothetical protein